MSKSKQGVVASCNVRQVPIPKTRDPFVNTPLISLGSDRSGVERFWISTWNSLEGCICALVDERGGHELFRPGPPHSGFYSAAPQDKHTLWLCGDLSRVVRFSLTRKTFTSFPTGAPSALVFQGMVFDPDTGKLFALAYPYSGTTAFSFDTRTKKTARIYEDIAPDHYMRRSFPNGDGTWSILVGTPGTSMLKWDPVNEEVQTVRKPPQSSDLRVIKDSDGKVYMAGQGWYDPLTGKLRKSGPKPEKKAAWFGRLGQTAYGSTWDSGHLIVHSWDLPTGKVTRVCDFPDTHTMNVNLTKSGKIIGVSMYGTLSIFDAETGAPECSRWLPSDAIGEVDCLCPISKSRLLGTPFITQRFWEADLRTGKGFDCGRAAPGGGEVLRTWKMGGKVYMAAYAGGELVQYDPSEHPHFPENPRVVADPPGGMRPVASADDGRHLYYASNAGYGKLGCSLTKYDTKTGIAIYHENPLGDQAIPSLVHDSVTGLLLCGTTYDADCRSCPPTSDRCYLARIGRKNAKSRSPKEGDLKVRETALAPLGTRSVRVEGPMGKGRWLCRFNSEEWGQKWASVDFQKLKDVGKEELQDFPAGYLDLRYAGRVGHFVLRFEDRLELWDMAKGRCLKLLVKIGPRHPMSKFWVIGRSIYFRRRKSIIVLEDVLSGR